jgi:hypothetical protein
LNILRKASDFNPGDLVMPKGIYPRTKEHNRHIAEGRMGANNPFYGKRHTEQQRLLWSIERREHPGCACAEETKKKISRANRGNKYRAGHALSDSAKNKIGMANKRWHKDHPSHQSGPNSHFWKGGITPENIILRASASYADWRKGVFRQDHYVCQHCSQRGGVLHAHHLLPFSMYPDHRLDVNNGITLCQCCHAKVHKTNLGTSTMGAVSSVTTRASRTLIISR